MNQQASMANMNTTGGPVGGTPLMNNGGARGPSDPQTLLNTYIYDYFLKNRNWTLARQIKNDLVININPQPKSSPGRRDVNGVDDMDTDNKDELDKRPDDLPLAAVPSDSVENSFLFDWWTQFWDIFNAQRQRSKPGSQQFQYLAHTRQQAQLRTENQQRILMTNNAQYRNMMGGMPANGMPMNMNEMQRKAMQNQRMNPQQMAQMKNAQQQHMIQNPMQRDGSQMDMNQRPQSPGSAENAPSPTKRPRLDNQGFNGQPMAPGARTQGMQPQQVGTTAAQAGQMLMANGIDPSNMTAQQFNAFQGQTPNVQAKSIQEMNSAGMQNSPMGQQGADGFQDFSQGNAQARMQAAPPGQQPGGNHALQDYQMQLMLLEQQNKKRLLMARQEQDNITQHPGSGPVTQPGFPPAMSPQGSRAGPSPNPNDQMKRGTPKLNQAGLPGSPMPDGSMPQNRSSPMPNGFDPSQMPPGMPPQYYQQMGANNMMRPPSSHPGFQGQMTPAQMEMLRRTGGQVPNGMWPQGGPPQMMPQQPQQGQQQPMPMGTPQQRNQMPPPPAPAAGNESQRTQPSSPAPTQNQPPTPSQANKPNPKKKGGKPEDKKGAQKPQPAKKGSTAGATPASEAEPPPTPTPTQPATAPPQPTAPANPPQPVATAPQMDTSTTVQFGDLGGDTGPFNLDFGPLEGGDVLENFDFDTFLHTDDGAGGPFGTFDPNNFSMGDNGVEADAGI